MELFLSWSKPRSQSLALILYSWIPDVIQQVRPWMSSEDIVKGQRWATEVGARLDSGSQGLICVTRENFNEPWLNFEAGALAKSLSEGRVRPILFDLRPAEVKGPLSQFQATAVSDKADMQKLIRSLNEQCAEPLDDARLAKAFERGWKDFEQELTQIPPAAPDAETPPTRSVDDMMRELLERVREMQRSMVPRGAISMPKIMSKGEVAYSKGVQSAFERLGWEFFPVHSSRGIDGVVVIQPSMAVNVIIGLRLSSTQLQVHLKRHIEMLNIDPTIRLVIVMHMLGNDPDISEFLDATDSFALVRWSGPDDDLKIYNAAMSFLLAEAGGKKESEGI
ncbi:hypothetical protein [Micromonospora sp. NPDC003241]